MSNQDPTFSSFFPVLSGVSCLFWKAKGPQVSVQNAQATVTSLNKLMDYSAFALILKQRSKQNISSLISLGKGLVGEQSLSTLE